MRRVENQNVEFKESWRDECLKTICAFANTSGGELYIGVDDTGNVKGIENGDKLLEDVPSKVKEFLGLLAGVTLKGAKGKKYLEIKITPYDAPISFKGKYYVRSGSTTQELNGVELQRFLLKKANTSWESVIEDGASIDDIDDSMIDRFRVLSKEKSPLASKEKNDEQLLSKLHLQVKGKLTRAAILLFGKDPQHFYPGSFTRVGRFSNDDTLISTDEIKGNLFEQADGTLQMLKNKYLSSQVRIEGLYRNEELEYPETALREAIINAIAHKEYSGSHIQIKVYPDRLVFWNPGELPKDLTIEQLKKRHPSHPRNKVIAAVFYASGLIEAWGSGTMKMVKECIKAKLPEPVFEEYSGGMQVSFSKDLYTEEHLRKKGLNERQIKGVLYLKEYYSITNQKYQQITGVIKRTASRDLSELIDKKILVKFGTTGKGTTYGLKGRPRSSEPNPIKSFPIGDLDKKLEELDKELEVFDPEDELKVQFSKELFIQIFDTWFSDLVTEVVPIIQKFNKYFVNPSHYLNLPNTLGGTVFSNEEPSEILDKLRRECLVNLERLQMYDSNCRIQTNYGAFRRTGLDTFGCNYSIEVVFSENWYEVFMDDEVMKRNRNPQLKRQYHKPLTKDEAKALASKFGDVIYRHITLAVDEIHKKKKLGDSKGTKETEK